METPIQNNIVFGLRAIIEAILAGKTFDKIFIKQGTKGELATELLILAKEKEISFKMRFLLMFRLLQMDIWKPILLYH